MKTQLDKKNEYGRKKYLLINNNTEKGKEINCLFDFLPMIYEIIFLISTFFLLFIGTDSLYQDLTFDWTIAVMWIKKGSKYDLFIYLVTKTG